VPPNPNPNPPGIGGGALANPKPVEPAGEARRNPEPNSEGEGAPENADVCDVGLAKENSKPVHGDARVGDCEAVAEKAPKELG